MDNAALQAKLAAILDAFPTKSALHCVDLTSGEVMASLRAETRVVSASTIWTRTRSSSGLMFTLATLNTSVYAFMQ